MIAIAVSVRMKVTTFVIAIITPVDSEFNPDSFDPSLSDPSLCDPSLSDPV